ncbi:hypothetical protein [Methanovulcanius yangii]|uniref:hypothetical protein n=1 Tax=Methanovulcanius yangii TaxID=1789227 RepID=UPI0029CA27D1|nr:hypothetical protein [Methanovulcanius yangii]
MEKLYNKSLMLETPSDFHPILKFYFLDAIAHIDYTICILSFNILSPRNMMNMEYMRWRIDQEKLDDRNIFPGFINWLKAEHPENFERLPTIWKEIYDTDSEAGYRSFRIALKQVERQPLPPQFFLKVVDEMYDKNFLKSLYKDGSLGKLIESYRATLS